LAINIIKEVLDQTRGYRGVLEANIRRTGYSPSKTLEYDGKYWFYIGGTFDGFTGDWTVVFKENALALATDVQVTVIDEPGTNLTSNLLQAISSGRNQSIEAGASDGMRLALEASGSVSQIQVYDRAGYVEVKAGQVLRLVNPVTLSGEQVTASLDRSGDVITIDTKTLTESYPAGSYVFLSAESLSAGIAIGENAVKIYAEGQSLGRLAQPIDGTVTQIEAHLYTKLVRGMDFLIINQQTGRTYSFNVDQDTAGPGVVTFNVQEQIATARVGDYLVGDNSFQQSQITVSQGEIVLKVDSNNRVALVRLSADNDSGSEIDISAEQVKINGIIFTEGTVSPAVPGDIKSSNYLAGADGWKIEGNGDAEFNDVVVRGELIAGTSDGLFEAKSSGVTVTQSIGGDDFKNRISYDGFSNYVDNDLQSFFGLDDTLGGGVSILNGAPGVQIQLIGRTGEGIFTGVVTVANATANTHALNRQTGDARYMSSTGAVFSNKTIVTSSTYAVQASDYIIHLNRLASGVSVTLPAATGSGRIVVITDYSGDSFNAPHSVNPTGADLIDGGLGISFESNYGSLALQDASSGYWKSIYSYIVP
jgi:hypothetical protein